MPGSGGAPQPVNSKRTVGVTVQPAVASLMARVDVDAKEKPLGKCGTAKQPLCYLNIRPGLPLIVYKQSTTRGSRNPQLQKASVVGSAVKKDGVYNPGENYMQVFTSFNGVPMANEQGVLMSQDEFDELFYFPGWASPETSYTVGDVAQADKNGNCMFQGLFASVNLSHDILYPGDRLVVLPPLVDDTERAKWENTRLVKQGYNGNYPRELQVPRMKRFNMREDFDAIRRKAIHSAAKPLLVSGGRPMPIDFSALSGNGAMLARTSRSDLLGQKIIRSDMAKVLAALHALQVAGKIQFGAGGTLSSLTTDLFGGASLAGQSQPANPVLQAQVVRAMYPRAAQAADPARPSLATPPSQLNNFLILVDREEAHAQALIVEKVLESVKGQAGGKSVPGSDLIVVA